MISVEQLIAEVLQIPSQRITEDLCYGAIPEWDSLNHVNLMLALESAYSTSIDEDLMFELTSVRALRAFARRPV